MDNVSKIDYLKFDKPVALPLKKKAETILPVKKIPKKIQNPFENLKKRISKDFLKKKLIGDIIIRDHEYAMLIDYFKVKCRGIRSSGNHIANDPIFATALVQIGIKYYDGNFGDMLRKYLKLEK